MYKVNNGFSCSDNNLTSLKGSPTIIKGDFRCYDQKNGHNFTVDEVKKHCKVGGKIYI